MIQTNLSHNLPLIRREVKQSHEQASLFCWHIRVGMYRETELERMAAYADCFYEDYMIPHIEQQEKGIFTFGGADPQLVKRAITDHKRLRRLFEDKSDLKRSLSQIEEKLEEHLRFEQKVLFNQIGRFLTRDLKKPAVELLEPRIFSRKVSCWPDRYWDLE